MEYKFTLKYLEQDELYVSVNDVITMVQKLAIMSDDDIDEILKKHQPSQVITETGKFGKKAARKITSFIIEALDGKQTEFEIVKKKDLPT